MSRTSSVVEYFAEREGYKCGYCNSPDTNFSRGMWAHILQVQDYQDLIDRGWRRSGKYCYKPTLDRTCCPMYTIRCEALDFKISKSQKRILKKVSKFLGGKLKVNDNMHLAQSLGTGNDTDISDMPHHMELMQRVQNNVVDINISAIEHTLAADSPNISIESKNMSPISGNNNSNAVHSVGDVSQMNITARECKPGMGLDQSKPPPKKAKLMRLERKQNKLLALGKSPSEVTDIIKHSKQPTTGKGLEELLGEENNGVNKLEIKLVRTSPMSSEYKNTSKQTYELYKKYQMGIHSDPADKISEGQYSRFLVSSPLQIKLVGVSTEEFLKTFKISAKVFKKYQMAIHRESPEECGESSFTDFLCKTPLQGLHMTNGPSHGYGSFHQQYWLNGELIAVGVIDILPFCVSSVYFFYDPAYSHLSLGTYGSLREIMLTKQLNKVSSDIKYYYMGFYIHSCPKMRYKAALCPSKLLCPETYVWCNIEDCLPKLDKSKYSRLNEDLDAIDRDRVGDVSQVSILYRGRAIYYHMYKRQADYTADEDEIREYVNLVGMKCSRSLLLYRN